MVQSVTTSTLYWQTNKQRFELAKRPLLMGIVNVTPDSFSDGGRYFAVNQAVEHGLQLIEEGADLLDIGGESTRPQAIPVPVEEELQRVLPVVEQLVEQTTVPLSIDTSKAEVAKHSLERGASIINDVTALGMNFTDNETRINEDMLQVVCEHRPGLILMHMQHKPATMQDNPNYGNVVEEIFHFLHHRIETLVQRGVDRLTIATDPGIGFGKTSVHNLDLLRRLERFQALDRPLCLGVSRKKFLGRLLNRPVEDRMPGSLAMACHAMGRNAAQMLRVHDVAATRDAIEIYQAMRVT